MRSLVAGLLVMLCGCASMRVGSPGGPERWESEAEAYDRKMAEQHAAESAAEDGLSQLLQRARFDLQCDAAAVVVLERANEDGPAVLVGARGCGQQVQYRRRLRRSGWTGNYTARNAGAWMRARPDGALQTVVVAHDP